MISYITICDNPENGFVRCEVELIPAIESKVEDWETKEYVMKHLSMSLFQAFFDLIGYEKPISKGDIFVVEHEDGEVFRIIFKDDEEALKRWDFFDDLI